LRRGAAGTKTGLTIGQPHRECAFGRSVGTDHITRTRGGPASVSLPEPRSGGEHAAIHHSALSVPGGPLPRAAPVSVRANDSATAGARSRQPRKEGPQTPLSRAREGGAKTGGRLSSSLVGRKAHRFPGMTIAADVPLGTRAIDQRAYGPETQQRGACSFRAGSWMEMRPCWPARTVLRA